MDDLIRKTTFGLFVLFSVLILFALLNVTIQTTVNRRACVDVGYVYIGGYCTNTEIVPDEVYR